MLEHRWGLPPPDPALSAAERDLESRVQRRRLTLDSVYEAIHGLGSLPEPMSPTLTAVADQIGVARSTLTWFLERRGMKKRSALVPMGFELGPNFKDVIYPYRPGRRGINVEEIFAKISQGVPADDIVGGSGRVLHWMTNDENKTFLTIFDKEDERFSLFGSYTGSEASFNLRTRDYLSQSPKQPFKPHPDMFARAFVRFMIEEFFPRQGVHIETVEASWLHDSDSLNYDLFTYFLNLYTHDPNQSAVRELLQMLLNRFRVDRVDKEAMKKAAANTWTGKLLFELGFTQIEEVIYHKGSEAEVRFSKPKSQALPQ